MSNNPDEFNDEPLFDDEDKAMPDEKALIEQARSLELEDRDEEAYGIVRRVLKTNPDNIDAMVLYAQLAPDKGNAEKALNKALRLDPNHVEAKRELKRLQKSLATKGKVDEFGFSSSSNDESSVQQLVRQNQQLMQQMQQQPAQQPVINIINENVNQNVNQGFGGGEQRNGAAFVAGLIGGWVFGLLGIAHLVNGKIVSGVAYLLIGTALYWTLWAVVVGLSLGAGLICMVPLHFIAIWQHAKQGASYI